MVALILSIIGIARRVIKIGIKEDEYMHINMNFKVTKLIKSHADSKLYTPAGWLVDKFRLKLPLTISKLCFNNILDVNNIQTSITTHRNNIVATLLLALFKSAPQITNDNQLQPITTATYIQFRSHKMGGAISRDL